MSNTEKFLKEALPASRRQVASTALLQKRRIKRVFAQAAKLFRAACGSGRGHAANHLRALKAIKSTKENLQAA